GVWGYLVRGGGVAWGGVDGGGACWVGGGGWGRRKWHGDVRTLRTYQVVLRRAEYLPTTDQNLLRLALEGQHGFRQLGTLFGRSAGETCRRVKRLLQRLRDPVVAALIDFPVDLPEEHRAVGLAHFVQGKAIREIAKEMRISVEEARSMIDYIRGWARMAQRVWVAESVKRLEEGAD
ncbi:MAG: hypothetical protein ACM359_03285, partial [Bacillota bacterium]